MIKVWMVRPFPHDIDRLSEFKSNNIIAIGWPELTSLTGKHENELREMLRDHPNDYSPSQLGVALATVDIVVNRMSKNDLVVLPYHEDIYFAKVTSDYFYEPNKVEDGYPHQRSIEWLRDGAAVSRDQLPNSLRNSLRAPRTATELSKHLSLVKNIVEASSSEDLQSVSDYMDITYPLRTDLNCTITIPKNITKEEAERLGDFVKTLHFNQ